MCATTFCVCAQGAKASWEAKAQQKAALEAMAHSLERAVVDKVAQVGHHLHAICNIHPLTVPAHVAMIERMRWRFEYFFA